MAKGRLAPPNLDDRTWQMIVDEAKSLIPKYAPEWTDHNPSDLGITLIELFAWLSEQTIYRLNRVPDGNYIKFLDLIGVRRGAPTPARADITFKIAGDAVVTVPRATQVSTIPSGTEDGIIFETEKELNAVNIKKCLFLDELNKYSDLTRKLVDGPFATTDLSVPSGKARLLLLGIGAPSTQTLSITFRINSQSNPVLPRWVYSTTNQPNSWQEFLPDTNRNYSFEKSDTIDIRVPAGWTQSKPADWIATPAQNENTVAESLYWLGIFFRNTGATAKQVKIDRVAANIVSAMNVITVNEEILGVSNGKPYQVFSLKNAPLYQDVRAADPLRHMVISVNTGGAWNTWDKVEEFTQENEPQYRCDPITGEISFGSYDTTDQDITKKPGYGRIPEIGSQIKAVAYRYVAGESNGNVPANTIVIQRTPVGGVTGVSNEQEATGGSDWEDVEDTKRRGPQMIKNRDRAVTVEDYEYHAQQATTDVAKVRCLPPRKLTETTWAAVPSTGTPLFVRTPGMVNVIIVPNIPNDPNDPNSRRPMPSAELIDEVKHYLDDRRTITSILNDPWPPFYVEIKVKVTVYVKPGQDTAFIKQQIQKRLFAYLHPVSGGPENKGWNIGQDLYVPDVFSVLESMPDISYVDELKIERTGGAVVSGVRVKIEDYELICASPSILNDSDPNYTISVEEEAVEP